MADKLKTLVLLGIFLCAYVVRNQSFFFHFSNRTDLLNHSTSTQVHAEEELSYDEQLKVCTYLNTVRANFTACCEYPGVVMWEWQLTNCEEECGATDENYENEDTFCCLSVCCFYTVKVLSSQTEIAPLLPDGFIYSFLLSVGNDTAWEPVITGAVNRCYSQYLDDQGYDCGVIPFSMYSIIDCAYLENYLKCPTWNPQNLRECAFTAEYARKCATPDERDPNEWFNENLNLSTSHAVWRKSF